MRNRSGKLNHFYVNNHEKNQPPTKCKYFGNCNVDL